MLKRGFPLLFVLVLNLWIYKIFQFNIVIGLIAVLTSIFLWLALGQEKKYYSYILIPLFLALLFLQYKTTSKNPLTYLSPGEKLKQEVRLRGYQPVSVKVASKIFFIPAANWLELRPETVAFYRIEEHLSEVLDQNLYFFANHPREKYGVIEFEKFPYILFPFFIAGMFYLKKRDIKIILISLSPLVLISVIGSDNPGGPFGLFPFFSALISLGISKVPYKTKFIVPLFIVIILVFIQTIAYAKY